MKKFGKKRFSREFDSRGPPRRFGERPQGFRGQGGGRFERPQGGGGGSGKPRFEGAGRGTREGGERQLSFKERQRREFDRKPFGGPRGQQGGYDRKPPQRDFAHAREAGGGRREFGGRPRGDFKRRGERESFQPTGFAQGARRDFQKPRFERREGGGERIFQKRELDRSPPQGEGRGFARREFERPRGEFPRDSGRRESGGPSTSSAPFVPRPRTERRNALLAAAREGVKQAYTGKGASLIQAVRALDDLDSAKSLVFSRLQEFFEINFPEFKLDNIDTYGKVIGISGGRENLDEKTLSQVVGISKAKKIMEDAKKSFGAEFTPDEQAAVKEFAGALVALSTARSNLEKFVEAESARVVPNLTHLTDPLLAARFLSIAGGLDKLATMPASTIQVIGAETALFKHLRTHGRTPPPKHGIIFQSPLVRGAPLEQRGKIARALAAKIAIAAKADAYTGNFIAEKLKADLEKRLAEIRR